ncbi:MAG: GNAT family N-acetyltransferase [Mesorhizobium sp.]|uniref:GNAT family N-acetyltransferase n=1 Tax=Mesorhizobium sp. TaxID=1871066 RepID=UPI000FE5CDBB|nr:GNAT family N-acetyltransferase [Mesorhizobium sp.]RWM98775.1 MAG: GNAT family N-acetyltransferase [Mesorhizobium sp.]
MVDLLVTYLEMTEPPSSDAFAAPVLHAMVTRETLGIADYISLYRAVGQSVQWDQRLRMSSSDLEDLLASPSTHIHVLRIDHEVAGLCEFTGVGQPVVELTHFGLIPAFQGRKLGPYLLDQSLRAVWSHGPEKLWLHTDTHDHPSAQSVYRRAGFKAYAQRMETFPD